MLRAWSVVVVALMLLGALPAAAQEPIDIRRIAGQNRVATAIAISNDDWADGAGGTVVLAREDGFPDALAGGPLAAGMRGPLLLTPGGALAPVVEAEIQRVLPAGGKVYLLGGLAALDQAVEDRVTDLGYAAMRLTGNSRYETALAIAREAAPEPGFITIATGNDFPDALIAGSLASTFAGGVLILTDGDTLPDVVAAYLADHEDVAQTTVGPAAAAAHPEVFNVAGATAADRSVRAARDFYDRDALRPDGVAVASVERFPDALAGAPHAYNNGSRPLLLTTEDALPQSLVDYVTELDAAGTSFVYGGNATINESVLDQLRSALES